MRILALNPFHGGSHQAFLEGWIARSRHEFEVLTLPAYKWKWRMRHAAVTFADELATRIGRGAKSPWDAVFCTDMLNLAEFRGLCPTTIRRLPSVAYFHENQLTYPQQQMSERDLHFAFTNLTTALAADAVWFNSAFHRDEFLIAARDWMLRMPDFQLHDAADRIKAKSSVHPPGIDVPTCSPSERGRQGPLTIAWVSRWEHDKAPETFFAAMNLLVERGSDFRLNVLGESFGKTPECFEQSLSVLSNHVDRWGYQPTRPAYLEALQASDVVVSTAMHEFFGIGVLEAVAAGCFPVVPRRLAYPEVLGDDAAFFFDGTATGLADRLVEVEAKRAGGKGPDERAARSQQILERFAWKTLAPAMDTAIDEVRSGPCIASG